MKSASRQETRKVAALFLAPFLVLGSTFGARACVSHFKTQDLIRWVGFQNGEQARQSLVEGANPNARTPDGWSMVMWAVGNNGNMDIVKMLKDAGAETNATEDLFVAAIEGDENAARTALQQGAAVDALEKDAWTPLIWASYSTHPKLVKLLLDSGANVNWKSKDAKTASSVAAEDSTARLLQNAVKASKRR